MVRVSVQFPGTQFITTYCPEAPDTTATTKKAQPSGASKRKLKKVVGGVNGTAQLLSRGTYDEQSMGGGGFRTNEI